MESTERARLLATLRATPRELARLLDGVEEDLLLWTPAPGKWSILEILCHLRDMERDAYLARYRRILSESRPSLPDVDADVTAFLGDYRSDDARAAFVEWRRLREEVLDLLLPLDEASWDRDGVHQKAGPLRVSDFLRRQAVGNDEAHLEQIRSIKERKALFLRLESTPDRLARATDGLQDELLRRRPAPESWAIVEIACHLRDLERVFGERFTKVAFQETPQLWLPDNDLAARRLRYREASLPAVLSELRRLRADTLALLRALPAPVWKRTGIHPTRGEITLGDLARLLADHDDRHLARIGQLAGFATPIDASLGEARGPEARPAELAYRPA